MPQWRKENANLLITPRGVEIECLCGDRVALESEFGTDVCPNCGRAWRMALISKEGSLSLGREPREAKIAEKVPLSRINIG